MSALYISPVLGCDLHYLPELRPKLVLRAPPNRQKLSARMRKEGLKSRFRGS